MSHQSCGRWWRCYETNRWAGIDELAWIVPAGNHRGAYDISQVPAPEHIARRVDLQIDALSLVDGVNVEDHSLPAWVNIVMETGDTNRAIVGHSCRHAIKLSAKKRGAGGNVKCIVEEHAVLGPYSCRTDPSDFGVSIDNDGRDRIGHSPSGG